jgi:hypothetical protein
MDDEREEWISKRAYGLWEAQGRPHGKDHEHWEQAARERVELEKVALPGHLRKDRPSRKAGPATQPSPDPIHPIPSEDGIRKPSIRH